jgi:hypothetical protein
MSRSSSGLFSLDFLAEILCEFFVACHMSAHFLCRYSSNKWDNPYFAQVVADKRNWRCLGSGVVVLCSIESRGQPLWAWGDHSVCIRGGESLSSWTTLSFRSWSVSMVQICNCVISVLYVHSWRFFNRTSCYYNVVRGLRTYDTHAQSGTWNELVRSWVRCDSKYRHWVLKITGWRYQERKKERKKEKDTNFLGSKAYLMLRHDFLLKTKWMRVKKTNVFVFVLAICAELTARWVCAELTARWVFIVISPLKNTTENEEQGNNERDFFIWGGINIL